MDISRIREFVMLAQCRHFSEAAERLFISQSARSKHIRSLERELGVELFARTTRAIRLSEAGALYLPYAQRMAAACTESEIALDDLKRRSSTSLTIAVLQNPQYYDLAKYITGFRQAYPELSFSMVEADENGLLEMLRKMAVSVIPAFSGAQLPEGCSFIPMAESAVVALFRRGHPCARQDHVTLERLGGERLLLPSRGGSLSARILDAFRQAGITPHVVYEGSSIGCIDLVKAGMGVSLHAREFAASLAEDGQICCLRLEPPISFAYGLAHRPPAELTHAEQLYLSYMKKYALK